MYSFFAQNTFCSPWSKCSFMWWLERAGRLLRPGRLALPLEPWKLLVLYSGWGLLSLLTGTPGGGGWSDNNRVHSTPAHSEYLPTIRFILAKHVLPFEGKCCPPPPLPQANLNLAFIYRLIDQITIKTPDPKCRLYWCLIEFIDWRYSQSCWYFRPLL